MNAFIRMIAAKLTQAGRNCQFPARRSKTTCIASVTFFFFNFHNFNDVFRAGFLHAITLTSKVIISFLLDPTMICEC